MAGGIQGMLGTAFGGGNKFFSGQNIAGIAGGLVGAGIGIAGAKSIADGAHGKDGKGLGGIIGGAALLGAGYGGVLGGHALADKGAIAAGAYGGIAGIGLTFDGITSRHNRGVGSVIGGLGMVAGAGIGVGMLASKTNTMGQMFGNQHIISSNNDIRNKIGSGLNKVWNG